MITVTIIFVAMTCEEKRFLQIEMIVGKSKSYDLVNTKKSWPRLRSIYIVHLSGFVFALGYSVVFTGLFAYLHQVSTEFIKRN